MSLKLMAELGLDGSGFEAGMRKAEHTVHSLGEGIKEFVVGAVGVATVGMAIEKTVESAKELVETSKRLGVAPEQLQVLRQAAKDSGTELDALAGAFEKLDIAREKALGGGQEGAKAKRAFGALGVDMGMLQSMTAAQLFSGPMAAAAKNRNPEELGIALKEVLGKGFGQLLPVLKTDFDELSKKMQSMGAIMDADTAVKLKMLSEEFSLLGQIITSQLGPALVKLAEWIYENILLKGGKKVAEVAAAAGAGTASWGARDFAKAGLAAVLPGAAAGLFGFDLGKNGGNTSGATKDFANRFNFNSEAAQKAAAEAGKPWQDKIDQFHKFLEELAKRADELKHPTAPNFTTPTLGEKMSKKALETQGDSLTKVGNFLGGMGVTARIEERKVQLLQEIANNTKCKPPGDSHQNDKLTNYPHF